MDATETAHAELRGSAENRESMGGAAPAHADAALVNPGLQGNVPKDGKNPVQVLAVTAEPDSANLLASGLREHDMAVNIITANDEQQFKAQLAQAQWDLIVCYETGAIQVDSVLAHFAAADLGLPLLVVRERDSSQDAAVLMARGASDVITASERRHLILAAKREVRNYQRLRERGRLEISLKDLKKCHQALLAGAGSAVGYLKDGRHIYCNDSYRALFACSDAEAMKDKPLLELVALKYHKRVTRLLAGALARPRRANVQALLPDGSALAVEMIFTALVYDGHDCVQVVAKAASGNLMYSRQKESMMNKDLLTRLDSRAWFLSKIEAAISTAMSKGVFSAILMIQLNDFDEIVAAVGKSEANMILNDISQFLRKSISKPFTASRLAGNEFGVLLYDGNPDEALELAHFIKGKINNHITPLNLSSVRLSSSIGVAVINGHALDADDILNKARINLNSDLESKQANYEFRVGGNLAHDAGDMLACLREALVQRRFRMFFQPIVSIRPDGLKRYEVQAPMLDGDGNEVPPASFLPLANINGMGGKVDKLTLELALAHLKGAERRTTNLMVSLTANSLSNKTLLPWLSDQLQRERVAGEQVLVQISEADLQGCYAQALAFCRDLEELDVQRVISCAGRNAIDCLAEFKPEFVKLDETVIRDLLYSQERQAEAKDLVKAIHGKGCKVIASQVGSMELLPALWEAEVDFVQGLGIQAPAPDMSYEFIQEEEITLDAVHA